jgi:hypothetical protein
MEYFENQNYYRPPPELIKYQNTLELIDSSRFIQELQQKMCGYIITSDKDGNKIFLREEGNRPFFSDDFMSLFSNYISHLSNSVTAQVEFTKDELNLRMRQYHMDIIILISCDGHEYFISQKTWEKIKDIASEKWVEVLNEDKTKELILVRNIKASQKVISERPIDGWKKRNIDWNKNAPITRLMLSVTCDPNEIADQEVVFAILEKQIYHFTECALRRSMDAITVKHHISPKQTFRQEYAPDKKESAVSRGMNNLQSGGSYQ